MDIIDKKYYMLEGEIGYPKFTGLRRKLSKMVDFAEEILEVMCPIYGIQEIPKVKFQYFVQKADCTELASGFHTAYLFKDNSVDYHLIGLSITDTREFPDRVMYETLPHEIAHTLHFHIDRKDLNENPHGEMFERICRLIEFQFPLTKLDKSFAILTWNEHLSNVTEDAHRFKIP